MLVLFDSPAGHCLFKVMDSGLLKKPEDIWDAFTSAESAKKACAACARPRLDAVVRCRANALLTRVCMCAHRVKLKAFHKFEDTAEAVQSATALVEGKLSAGMKKFLKKSIVSKELQARPTAAARRGPPQPAARALLPREAPARSLTPPPTATTAGDAGCGGREAGRRDQGEAWDRLHP